MSVRERRIFLAVIGFLTFASVYATVVVAPVITAPADNRSRIGVLDQTTVENESHGPGTGGQQERQGRPEITAPRGQVDGHPREVHEERGGGGGGHDLARREAEAKERGRANAALIAHQTAEEAGENAAEPASHRGARERRRAARELAEPGDEEERAEHAREHGTREPALERRTRQPSHRAREAELAEHGPGHVASQAEPTNQRGERVRERDEGDGDAGGKPEGEKRREEAADAEARDRGDGAGAEGNGGDEDGCAWRAHDCHVRRIPARANRLQSLFILEHAHELTAGAMPS